MKKHKCCKGKKSGQIIELRFMPLSSLPKREDCLLCFGYSNLTFHNSKTVYAGRGYTQTNSSSSSEYYLPFPNNFYTKTSQGISRDNWGEIPRDAVFGRPPVNFEARGREVVVQGLNSGTISSYNSQTHRGYNKGCYNEDCSPLISKSFIDIGGVGSKKGNCYTRQTLDRIDLVTINSNPIDRSNFRNALGWVDKEIGSTLTINSTAGGRVYCPDKPDLPIRLDVMSVCVNLDMTRKEINEVKFNVKTSGDFVVITVGNRQKQTIKIPKNSKFIGFDFVECGCAKGEIKCKNEQGKLCCIDCCEVVEKLYKEYKEVY